MKNIGWIKLHRKVLDSGLYNKLPFDAMHAFLDLLLLASYEDKTVMVRGVVIRQNLGEVVTTYNMLMKRWGWTRRKLRTFLESLTADETLECNSTHFVTIIKIINYSRYQIGARRTDEPGPEMPLQLRDVGEDLDYNERELMEVFLFDKCLVNARQEMNTFVDYYTKTGWRTATGVKIRSKKSAARVWEVKTDCRHHNQELLSQYKKVYNLATPEQKMMMLNITGIERIIREGKERTCIYCSRDLYLVLDAINKEYTDKWNNIWEFPVGYKFKK